MVQELQNLRRLLAGDAPAGRPAGPPTQRRLDQLEARHAVTPDLPPRPAGPTAKVICDSREQAGAVIKHLHELGAEVETRTLDIGDFVLSDRTVVERKTGKDFVDSLVDGRLFDQMVALKDYPRPFVVIEGSGLLGHRNIAAEALYGALASIATDYGIPVLQTADAMETARFLLAVAKREQNREKRRLVARPGNKGKDPEQVRLRILEALPGVSTGRAQALLDHFGTVSGVFQASADALAAVDLIGPTVAKRIRDVLDEPAAVTETVSRGT